MHQMPHCVAFVGVYILIAAGALMMLVGFLGCCGAIKESPCMLGLVRLRSPVSFHVQRLKVKLIQIKRLRVK